MSGGKPVVDGNDYNPDVVAGRTIDNRNKFGYEESGDYAGSFQRPEVSDGKLQNIVNDVYKGDRHPNYEGTGSTADAARWEFKKRTLKEKDTKADR